VTKTLIQGGTLASSGQQQDIVIEDGVITDIGKGLSGDETIDAKGMVLFPGLIDCHVHFREPGFEHKATMATEAASARAGGITCVCEMPNTDPPTVTVSALADKVQRASEITDCDIRFFFGVTSEPHIATLRELWTGDSGELQDLKKHCVGVKLFLDHSTGDQKIDEDIIESVFELCGEFDIPLVAHCEDPDENAQAAQMIESKDVSTHSFLRPARSEVKSIRMALRLATKHNTPFHIAHLSTQEGLDLVTEARKRGARVSCEVTPHHLIYSERDYDQLGTKGKMNPPLREMNDLNALRQGVEDGLIDCFATDHAPHTLAEKESGEPLDAPSGVPGVETVVPLMLSLYPAKTVYRMMFTNPNKIYRLGKEDLEKGSHANVVIVDPVTEWEIHAADLHTKCDWTPYEGKKVKGKVVQVV
jgi:dihydroorotase